VLVTGAAGQEQVVPLQPGLADLIDAYLASRKAWLGPESPDAAFFIDASAQPMTSSKVQYLIQRLDERTLKGARIQFWPSAGRMPPVLVEGRANRQALDGVGSMHPYRWKTWKMQ